MGGNSGAHNLLAIEFFPRYDRLKAADIAIATMLFEGR